MTASSGLCPKCGKFEDDCECAVDYSENIKLIRDRLRSGFGISDPIALVETGIKRGWIIPAKLGTYLSLHGNKS